jgi:hypothetical protein
MAKFLSTVEINAELSKLIREAEAEIVLISPFIKLHPNIRSILETKKVRHDVSIIVIFGKNKENLSQSLGKEDLEFFQGFPNIEIRYSERLHAKYYANEGSAILTSMNLYDFSQNTNIEFGILLKTNFLKDIAISIASDGSLDSQAYTYFHNEVIPQAELLFCRKPQYDKGIGGIGFGKKYLGSVETTNSLDKVFSNNAPQGKSAKTTPYVPKPTVAPASARPTGYCIRTGVAIPFNPKHPMSDNAYTSWKKFSNPDYEEKFCHFSGEASNGETTFSKPILRKNWNKAKETHSLK